MNSEDIKKHIYNIFKMQVLMPQSSEKMTVSSIEDTTKIEDLKLSNRLKAELAISMSMAFNLDIPYSIFDKAKTVLDIFEEVEKEYFFKKMIKKIEASIDEFENLTKNKYIIECSCKTENIPVHSWNGEKMKI